MSSSRSPCRRRRLPRRPPARPPAPPSCPGPRASRAARSSLHWPRRSSSKNKRIPRARHPAPRRGLPPWWRREEDDHAASSPWDKFGEPDNRMLLEIEQKFLEVYMRKVDKANWSQAQLGQAIAEAEAALAGICSVMSEAAHAR